MSERWLPVVGYEGFYEVSDLGRVRSVARRIRNRDWLGQVIAPFVSPKGYLRVPLNRCGFKVKHSVHRLVLEAFVGPCPPGHESLHGSAGPGVNELPNLRWGTSTENNEDRRLDGTLPFGEKHAMAQISEAIAREIKVRLALKPRSIDLAREFGVAKSLIDNIRAGKSWRHL